MKLFLQNSLTFTSTTMDKLFEQSFSIFHEFFASIDKIFILGGKLMTRLQFYEVLRFF